MHRPLLALFLLTYLACTGEVSESRPSPPGEPGKVGATPGEAPSDRPATPSTPTGPGEPTRPDLPSAVSCTTPSRRGGAPTLARLTRAEYSQAISDLLGVPGEHGAFLWPTTVEGYPSIADRLTDGAELFAYLTTAESLAARALDVLPELKDPAKHADPAAMRAFVTSFGARAYRRPLTDDEVSETMKLYDKGRSSGPREGVVWALTALLGSPHLIYRVEAPSATGALVPLGPTERASRLSFFLTGSAPDPALMDAARRGLLADDAEVARQARRLIDSERGRARIVAFVRQWTGAESADPLVGDRLATFAPSDKTIQRELLGSLSALAAKAVAATDGLKELLGVRETFVNAPLAKAWGLPGSFGAAFTPVSFEQEPRQGVLTHPAFLTVHSTNGFASASIRGQAVARHVVCAPVPEPDDNVMNMFPEIKQPLETDRRTLEVLHIANPVCAGCHKALDGLGFAFEHFDQRGRYRATQENVKGRPTAIDASGRVSLDGREYTYQDARGFSDALAGSRQVRACFARELFRFAHRRGETDEESCRLQHLARAWEQSGGRLSELFVAVATMDAFLYIDRNAKP